MQFQEDSLSPEVYGHKMSPPSANLTAATSNLTGFEEGSIKSIKLDYKDMTQEQF